MRVVFYHEHFLSVTSMSSSDWLQERLLRLVPVHPLHGPRHILASTTGGVGAGGNSLWAVMLAVRAVKSAMTFSSVWTQSHW